MHIQDLYLDCRLTSSAVLPRSILFTLLDFYLVCLLTYPILGAHLLLVPTTSCHVFHQATKSVCVHLCMLKRFFDMTFMLIKLPADSNQQSCMLQAQVSHLPFTWHVKDEHLACGLCYTSGTTGNPKVKCSTGSGSNAWTAYLAIHRCMSMLIH